MTIASNTSYEDWIPKWTLHSIRTDNTIQVPPTAAAITTPLITQSWLSLLVNYPNKMLTEFFITGISQDLGIGFNAPQLSLKSASHNLACALHHPEVVDQYLSEELTQHQVAGPFNKSVDPFRAHQQVWSHTQEPPAK